MTEREKSEEQHKRPVSWRDVARFSWNYWRPNKWLGGSSAVLMLLAVSMDAIVPVYTGRIVDAMTSGSGNCATSRAAWTAFAMFALLAFLHLALRSGSVFVWNAFAVRNLQSIVTESLRKVQRFNSDWQANAFA